VTTSNDDNVPLLKCRELFWDPNNVEMVAALKVAPQHLPKPTLVRLVHELNRRLMQMQDKVAFEREHNLVDYNLLEKGNDDA
jgi:hypothetical protein